MYRSGGSKSCLIPTTSHDAEPDVMSSVSLIPMPKMVQVPAYQDHDRHPRSERGDPEGQELADLAPITESSASKE